MKRKLLSLLGLARRAGRLSLGNDPVLDAIQKKEAKLLLAAADLSPRTFKGIQAAARAGAVRLIHTGIAMEELEFAVGKRAGVLSVNDQGFAQKIEQLCDAIEKNPLQNGD